MLCASAGPIAGDIIALSFQNADEENPTAGAMDGEARNEIVADIATTVSCESESAPGPTTENAASSGPHPLNWRNPSRIRATSARAKPMTTRAIHKPRIIR